MSQEQYIYNLRLALNEALIANDYLSRDVERLKKETESDRICGSWRLSEDKTVHVRKTEWGQYQVSVWNKTVRTKTMTLKYNDRVLEAFDTEGGLVGCVYFLPLCDSLLIEGIGLCMSIEKSDA